MNITGILKKLNKNKVIIVLYFLIFFANNWVPRLLGHNLFIVVLLGIPGLLFFAFQLFPKLKKKILYISLFVFVVFFTVVLIGGYDYSLFVAKGEEIASQGNRHQLYAQSLGSLFENKISLKFFSYYQLPLSKYMSNLAYPIDPNVYFFADHPRERLGVEVFEKFPFFYLPFFGVGFWLLLKRVNWLLIWYLLITLFVSGLITPKNSIGPILYFPIVLYLIVSGFEYVAKVIGKKYETK